MPEGSNLLTADFDRQFRLWMEGSNLPYHLKSMLGEQYYNLLGRYLTQRFSPGGEALGDFGGWLNTVGTEAWRQGGAATPQMAQQALNWANTQASPEVKEWFEANPYETYAMAMQGNYNRLPGAMQQWQQRQASRRFQGYQDILAQGLQGTPGWMDWLYGRGLW